MFVISFLLVMIGVFLNIKIFKIKIFVNFLNSVAGDVSHDPEHNIYNFSIHTLTKAEKSFWCRSLQFALPPKTSEYADYIVSIELLCRDIKTSNLNTLQNETAKSKFFFL